MYLLDTMVISEFQKKVPDPKVASWLNSHSISCCYLSVITIGEIYKGICREENRNPQFALRLTQWVKTLKNKFDSRILPINNEIAKIWGMISYRTGNQSPDNLIAATAKVYDLTVVTRNIKHFNLTGVSCINPWA